MADIRPPQWPAVRTLQPPAPAKPDARVAAQRAFFEAALAGTSVAAPAPATPRKPDLHVQMPAEHPQRILRPGSIVDIKV